MAKAVGLVAVMGTLVALGFGFVAVQRNVAPEPNVAALARASTGAANPDRPRLTGAVLTDADFATTGSGAPEAPAPVAESMDPETDEDDTAKLARVAIPAEALETSSTAVPIFDPMDDASIILGGVEVDIFHSALDDPGPLGTPAPSASFSPFDELR